MRLLRQLVFLSQKWPENGTFATKPERGIKGDFPSAQACSFSFEQVTKPGRHQSSCEASLAPSTMDASFAHTMLVSTFRPQADVPKPQSLPAMTFSLPTALA